MYFCARFLSIFHARKCSKVDGATVRRVQPKRISVRSFAPRLSLDVNFPDLSKRNTFFSPLEKRRSENRISPLALPH